jgi:hypothetical protein
MAGNKIFVLLLSAKLYGLVGGTKIQEPEERETYLIIADYFSSMPEVCSHWAGSSDPKFIFPIIIARAATYKPVIIPERFVKQAS